MMAAHKNSSDKAAKYVSSQDNNNNNNNNSRDIIVDGDNEGHKTDEFAVMQSQSGKPLNGQRMAENGGQRMAENGGQRMAENGGQSEGCKLIGIDGKWYDITTFLPHHPGGDIIESYVGRDASTAFHSFHHKDHFKHRRVVGTYKMEYENDKTYVIYSKLRQTLMDEGLFAPDKRWFAMKMAVCMALLAWATLLIACDPQGKHEAHTAWFTQCVGALLLAAFWQQSGFLMHDFMHTHVTRDRRTDHALGRLFGTACLGVSATWWRDEHFTHHALTNSIDHASNFCDPQMNEKTWAQNDKLFPFFRHTAGRLAVRVQHITFLPLCVFAGRAAIAVDSFAGARPAWEWVAGVVHWVCVGTLLSRLPTWQEAAFVYFLASSAQGVLHIQLLLSHYIKPFYSKDEMAGSASWFANQVGCTMDIANPWWLDWFHGGLNFHVAHHLFPTMPRHSYRRATEHIRKACQRAGLHYHALTWTSALWATLAHLKTMSHHFSLDPR